MNRHDAWNLLCEFNTSDSLRKHALAVECAMRAYARRYGQDEELWGSSVLSTMWTMNEPDDSRAHCRWCQNHARARLAGRDRPDHALARGLFRGAAHDSDAKNARSGGRADWSHLGGGPGAPQQKYCRRDGQERQEQVEEQGVRRRGESREIEQCAADLGVPLDEHIGVVLAPCRQTHPSWAWTNQI